MIDLLEDDDIVCLVWHEIWLLVVDELVWANMITCPLSMAACPPVRNHEHCLICNPVLTLQHLQKASCVAAYVCI